MSENKQILTAEHYQDIDRWIAKYPVDQKKSAVMSALRIAQDANGGYLTEELMKTIADYLEMPQIAVYEVATFYGMYELSPVGKHKLCICTNISCMLSGSDQIVQYLKDKLGIGLGETSKDNRYTLKEVECLGACCGAPVIQIGNDYYEHLTSEKIEKILADLE